MSNLIHCDGPGCDKTKNRDIEPRMCDTPWLHLEQGDRTPVLDFHSQGCLAAWVGGTRPAQTGTRTPEAGTPGDQPCTCRRAKADPHSKADHEAYPQLCDTTTVDGR